MKKYPALICLLCMIFCFSCCKVKTQGESLDAFTERMNEKSDYNLTCEGYIFDKSTNTFRKFYTVENINLMLSFKGDDENSLTSMNIVFDTVTQNNTATLKFIADCLNSFIDNGEILKKLNEFADFEKILSTKGYETIKKEIGSTEILIDTTDVGVVITVNKKV